MAALAVHDKKEEDEKFLSFLKCIKKQSDDDRNFVKKAVNWALRQIGKRSIYLNTKAVEIAREIKGYGSKSARWITAGALKELKSEKVARRIGRDC